MKNILKQKNLIILAIGIVVIIGGAIWKFQELNNTTKLTLLQFNILNAGGDDEGFNSIVKIMKESNADIIAISKVRADSTDTKNPGPVGESIAADLAKALEFYYYDQSDFYQDDFKRTNGHPAIWANAILSRYPIVKGTPLGLGALINVKGKEVHVFNLNLDYKPNVPYQLHNIEYEGFPFINTEEEAIKYANIAHKDAINEVIQEVSSETKQSSLVLIMGDFNEPSHRDWTIQGTKFHKIKVAWPTTIMLEDAGFVDTYRAANPDEVAKQGLTWTPTTEENDPNDHHDRIDYIFARAKNLKIKQSIVLGEKTEKADKVFIPWVSDHRAVLSVIEF